MKKLLVASMAVLVMCGSSVAEVVQIDDVFTKTNQWLNEQNLNLTGGGTNGARDDLSAFGQEALLFYGEAYGNPAHQTMAQREGMAKRAAVVVAQRALVEYLEGFALVGDTYVKDCMANYDVIRSAVSGFAKGVQVVHQDYSKDKDTAIAIVKMGLHGPQSFGGLMYDRLLSDPKLKKEITTSSPAFTVKQVPTDESYDGLIIDATEQDFRPALINRIFTEKGEVIYDPAKIEKKLLVEQGCGEYAGNLDKAREALAKRGVKNPLIVTAVGSTSKADLKVSDEDAVKVYSANQKGQFFKAARVAFVLK